MQNLYQSLVTQFRMKCVKCGEISDVTKYVVTPTYTFVAQACGHRHFLDSTTLQSRLGELGIRDPLIKEELARNLVRDKNYPTGEGKHE